MALSLSGQGHLPKSRLTEPSWPVIRCPGWWVPPDLAVSVQVPCMGRARLYLGAHGLHRPPPLSQAPHTCHAPGTCPVRPKLQTGTRRITGRPLTLKEHRAQQGSEAHT